MCIYTETGFEKFLLAGLQSSSIIAKVVSEWNRCEELMDFDKLELVANDLDIYYGTFTEDENAHFVIDLHGIKKYKVHGVTLGAKHSEML